MVRILTKSLQTCSSRCNYSPAPAYLGTCYCCNASLLLFQARTGTCVPCYSCACMPRSLHLTASPSTLPRTPSAFDHVRRRGIESQLHMLSHVYCEGLACVAGRVFLGEVRCRRKCSCKPCFHAKKRGPVRVRPAALLASPQGHRREPLPAPTTMIMMIVLGPIMTSFSQRKPLP